jgi:hypothetical protein
MASPKIKERFSTQEVVKTKPQQRINDSNQSMNLYYDYQIQKPNQEKEVEMC